MTLQHVRDKAYLCTTCHSKCAVINILHFMAFLMYFYGVVLYDVMILIKCYYCNKNIIKLLFKC